MNNRIDLTWGSGSHNVVFDLQRNEFFHYAGAGVPAVHETFGGRNYYNSRSGCSGAGWIPSSHGIALCSTYRVDSHRIQSCQGNTTFGWEIIVPTSGYSGEWPTKDGREYPVVMRQQPWHQWILVSRWQVKSLLLANNQSSLVEVGSHTLRYYPSPASLELESVWQYSTTMSGCDRGPQWPDMGRMHETFGPAINCEVEKPDNTSAFWSRLGLWPVGDVVTKIVRGIARARYYRVDLADPAALRQAAPANVEVLEGNFYLQSDGQRWEAVGLFPFDFDGQTVEVDYELSLSGREALALLARESEALSKVREELRQGAFGKAESEARFARQEAEVVVEEERRHVVISEAIGRHHDVVVTVADSVASGNCLPGSEAFGLSEFGSREPKGITLGQLWPRYASNWNVRRLVEDKLYQLGEDIACPATSDVELIEELEPEESRIVDNDDTDNIAEKFKVIVS